MQGTVKTGRPSACVKEQALSEKWLGTLADGTLQLLDYIRGVLGSHVKGVELESQPSAGLPATEQLHLALLVTRANMTTGSVRFFLGHDFTVQQ